MAANFPKHVPHKLHLVTLIGSGIRRPWWEKQALKTLGLTRRKKRVVLKNTPQNNELLRKIKTLVHVQPVKFVQDEPTIQESVPLQNVMSDLAKEPEKLGNIKLLSAPFLNERGEFDLQKYQDYIDNFPAEDFEDVLSKSHKIGSETLNYDFELEQEQDIKEQGRRVELYFLKKVWPKYKKRLADRQRNTSKY